MTASRGLEKARPTLLIAGPELVAGALSGLVVVIILAMLVGSGSPGSTSTTTPSARPTAAAGASGGATESAPIAVQPWTSVAAAIIREDERLLVERAALASALDDRGATSSDIVPHLRAMNRILTTLEAATRNVEGSTQVRAAVADLADVHRAASAAIAQTLKASLRNTAAYREGATAVVESLADLEGRMRQLASVASLPAPSIP